MGKLSKICNRLLWILFFGVGFYIVFAGGKRFWSKDMMSLLPEGKDALQRVGQREFARCLYPGLFFSQEEGAEDASFTAWYISRVMQMHPLSRLEYGAKRPAGTQSAATYEMLVTGGVHDEEEAAPSGQESDTEALAQEENETAARRMAEAEQQAEAARRAKAEEADRAAGTEEGHPETVLAGAIYNLEELSDFDYLFEHFYTMDANTTISAADLNAETLLSKDMRIDSEAEGPQILVYHTHSQEGFVDSVPGDNSTTIVGVGEYLTELLRDRGYEVMHVTSVFDLVDGKLDRNEAYSKAAAQISAILEENPSIQSVIDLHRDGVKEGTRLVTEIDGKPMAKFMFFNGLSRSKANGPIEYLYNPYIEDNLALTLQLKLKCEQYYPGLSRNIYLKSLRYNLHLSKKALLIEVGAQTNTLEEMLNTMEPLADILDKVFHAL